MKKSDLLKKIENLKDNEEVKGIVSLGDLAVEKIPKEEIGETLKEISTPCSPSF